MAHAMRLFYQENWHLVRTVRLLALLGLFGLFSISTQAQILTPVKWAMDYKYVDGDQFDLIYTASVDPGWYIYSQYLESDDGPVRTGFFYDEGGHFALSGKNVEKGKKKEGYDELFDMNVIKFSNKVVFTQRVKAADMSKPITGYLEFMTCDATKCLPPEQVDFEFKLEKPAAESSETGQVPGDKRSGQNIDKPKAVDKIVSPDVVKNPVIKEVDKIAAETKANASDQMKEAAQQVEDVAAELGEIASGDELMADDPNEEGGLLEPVSWSVSAKQVSEGVYDLLVKADIIPGWYIYSQKLDGEDGPIPTSFYFTEGDHVKFVGETTESGPQRVKEFDKFFEMDLVKFKKSATFTQRVEVSDISKVIGGELEFMTCTTGKCLPPDFVTFAANLKDNTFVVGQRAEQLLAGKSIDDLETPDQAIANVPGINQGPNGDNPELFDLQYDAVAKPAKICEDEALRVEDTSSLWNIFFLGIAGGLVALLTPCVFPMIPLTVSFFTKGSEDRKKGLSNAFLYGFFIFAVYIALSVPFHLLDSVNPDILSEISTNVWLNLIFFAIFIFFAFSFFGYYELMLPSSWTNKASSAEGVGGVVGIFFMALTLALVSFSCTGPILGSLLAGAMSAEGGAWQLTAGMAGFGVALGVPFALFAAFPSVMNALPRSGGWLNSVKVVLGFLELALAFKFLSNADLVKHWGLLKIEPFLAIWILIFAGLAAYLFGFIKFPHDSKLAKISPVRMGLGALSAAFVLYLASGFMYDEKTEGFSSLTLLSGLAPPTGYSWIYPNKCPNNLDCFHDLEKGLAYAKEVNKPVMIDFTGYACVNCRKMEEIVWPKQKISKYLEEDFVLISLYVDDKKELPEAERVTVTMKTGKTRKLRNYGNKWAHFQTEYFNVNSQPYYALLSPEGKLLNNPVPYTPDVEEYADFLECGLQSFKALTSNGGVEEAIGSVE